MSRTSVVPDLIDGLIALCAQSMDCTVSDTWPVDMNSGPRILFGVEDLDGERARGASSRQSWPHASKVSRDEEGEVYGAIWVTSGVESAKDARDAAYAISGTLEGLLRADVTVGIPAVLWTSYSPDWYTPYRLDTGFGVACAVYFSISYKARL